MSEKVQELLMERGNSFGLILDDISIVCSPLCHYCNAPVVLFRLI